MSIESCANCGVALLDEKDKIDASSKEDAEKVFVCHDCCREYWVRLGRI